MLEKNFCIKGLTFYHGAYDTENVKMLQLFAQGVEE